MPGDPDSVDGPAASVPLAAIPDPVATVGGEGPPSLVAWNGQFERRFEVAPDMALDAWWERNGLADREADYGAVRSALAAGDRMSVTVGRATDGGDRLRLRVTTGEGDTCHLFARPVREDAPGDDVDRIASVLSHDLRNPLDVAKANLRAARETGDDERFEAVARAHDRIGLIIEDVLALARGGGELDRRADVDIERVAAAAWESVETADATFTVDDAPAGVEADPDRVQRLLENLFRNAVEHGSTGSQPGADDAVEHGSTSPRPEDEDAVEHGSTSSQPGADDAVEHASGDTGAAVRLGRLDDGDGFYVADDGPGIDPAEHDRVFDSGYTDRDGGTGLGLTIVDRIATAHGWTVSLADAASGGARFEFRGVD
jgi:signal transduction histidine kinase